MPYEIKGVDNRQVAKILLDYVRGIKKEDVLLPALDAMLNDKPVEKIKGWDWKIAEIIEWNTSYIDVERDTDADFEYGDWGEPIAVGGKAEPIGVKAHHKDNLTDLRQEVDDILNDTNKIIDLFISDTQKPKWLCKNCGRFLGKELSSVKEIKELLKDFIVGKFWKCRSCKLSNYFAFTDKSIEFKSKNSIDA